MRTLIQNGTLLTSGAAVETDLLIEDEKISSVGGVILGADRVDRTIDARGKYVIPGAIDVHTHLDMPFAGTVTRDDFESGTRAAACGGTTSVVDFAIQKRDETLRQGLDAWAAKAEGKSAIDYGFHLIMSDVNDKSLKEMDALIELGVTTFKLFTAYPGVFYSDDAAIFRALQRTKMNGGLIMMHAENGLAIDAIAADMIEAGQTDPVYHGTSRPAPLEAEATNRVTTLAEVAGAPVYVVHLSATDALTTVRDSRARGQLTFAETCPHYLFLTEDQLGNGWEGAKYVCSPPLRTVSDQDALWRGLRQGDLQVVSSDHCAFDFDGQKTLGKHDFRKIPNGVPDIEHRVDLLHSGGVLTGRLTLQRWVDLIATAPAKLFGLYPKKGTLMPGADADIVIYDPEASHVLGHETQHARVDYNLYEGVTVQGAVVTVISRGTVIVDEGTYVGKPGWGQFIHRTPVDYSSV